MRIDINQKFIKGEGAVISYTKNGEKGFYMSGLRKKSIRFNLLI